MQKLTAKWPIFVAVVALLGVWAAMPAVSTAQGPVSIQFASFKMGSGWYVMAGVMAESIRKNLPAGSTVDVLPKSGGIGNPSLLGAKKADMGFAFPITANWAWNGKVRYKEKITNLRAIAGGLDSYWVLGAVRADKDIKSWADIKAMKKGLRICTQSKGSMSEVGALQTLSEYGVSYQDLKSIGGDILMKGFGEMVPALKEGAIDGFLMMATPNHPTWTEAAIARSLRFISLEEEVLNRLRKKYGYTRSIVPAGMFSGQDKDVVTIGFPTCLLAREDLPDRVVYVVLKSIVENKDKIRAAYRAFEAFDPKTAWEPEKVGSLPLHPGAEKFYKEKGYK
ncbi:MAG: TAXI family TRAP transporter solute-binding subunit [Deltaproteobacteria bacterium]|nr:TAXI family TRAP transporter solute-binding subunit [Deltaproteobacteria bacterium]